MGNEIYHFDIYPSMFNVANTIWLLYPKDIRRNTSASILHLLPPKQVLFGQGERGGGVEKSTIWNKYMYYIVNKLKIGPAIFMHQSNRHRPIATGNFQKIINHSFFKLFM